jgi:hypothetical protein
MQQCLLASPARRGGAADRPETLAGDEAESGSLPRIATVHDTRRRGVWTAVYCTVRYCTVHSTVKYLTAVALRTALCILRAAHIQVDCPARWLDVWAGSTPASQCLRLQGWRRRRRWVAAWLLLELLGALVRFRASCAALP